MSATRRTCGWGDPTGVQSSEPSSARPGGWHLPGRRACPARERGDHAQRRERLSSADGCLGSGHVDAEPPLFRGRGGGRPPHLHRRWVLQGRLREFPGVDLRRIAGRVVPGPPAAALNGIIYTFGGSRGDTPVDVVEFYNPATNQWRSAGPMPLPLSAQSAVSLGNRIYLFGGVASEGGLLRPDVWRYHPGSDEWNVLPSPMPTPRQGMAATVFDGRIHLIGGGGGWVRPKRCQRNLRAIGENG